jgi:acetylornithine deacetylase/succinyl-diaminopimelate desuccinylase-like protein
MYGHYDVQPPDPLEEWDSPPFEPTVRDGRIYARGADDSKGQTFCLLKAYEAVLDADRRPPLNVRFLFEGEEESGGRVVYDLLRSEPERAKVDAVRPWSASSRSSRTRTARSGSPSSTRRSSLPPRRS